NAPREAIALRGLELQGLDGGNPASTKFDLTITLEEGQGVGRGAISYSTDLFEAGTMKRLAGHYQRLLTEMSESPGEVLAAAQMLTDAEREQLLFGWNQTA